MKYQEQEAVNSLSYKQTREIFRSIEWTSNKTRCRNELSESLTAFERKDTQRDEINSEESNSIRQSSI